MNEELEQSDPSQDQSNEELKQSDGNQDQLIEIYKLQAQLANSISNRRTTIHRFYILVMSGLALIFPAFFKLPDEIQKSMPIELLLLGLALLGIVLSLTWFILINSNLRLSMLKYEALKRLEDKLDYQFFKDEWEFLEKYGRGRTYWEISYIEIIIPIPFFLIFALLLSFISISSPDKIYTYLNYIPLIIIGYFCRSVLVSWQIDREIRGQKKWTGMQMNLFVFAIMMVFVVILNVFKWKYHEFSNKEIKSADEKPADTGSEETTDQKIVGPDEQEVESVDEKPTEAGSDEAGKEENGHQ